jgi:hypothetical protein
LRAENAKLANQLREAKMRSRKVRAEMSSIEPNSSFFFLSSYKPGIVSHTHPFPDFC